MSKSMIQAAKAMDYADDSEKSNAYKIRALELQVHTLTAAVQHLMSICQPLIEIAQEAQQRSAIITSER